MFIKTVGLIALLLILPEPRAFIQTWASQASERISADFALFCIALTLALFASLVSWLMVHWPRSATSQPYRVIRRYRVW
jgi:hypothetical protein